MGTGIFVVIGECLAISLAMLAENIKSHIHDGDYRGNMIGGTPKKPAGQRGPGFKRGTPLHQLAVGRRKLPHAVDAVTGRRGRKRHLLLVLGGSLVVVHRSHGADAGAECRMTYVVFDKLAINEDLAPIAKT